MAEQNVNQNSEAAGEFAYDLQKARNDSVTFTDEPEFEFDDDEGFETKEGHLELHNLQEARNDSITSTDEPELEFDDDELSEIKGEQPKNTDGDTYNGLLDEDFERELGTPQGEDHSEFNDIERLGFLEVAGDDVYGRKVIVVSACRLPSNKLYDQQKLLKYIKHTLDKYVEQDYVLVYFHHGLNSGNKPKLSWLLQAYREFDRKYKKNLKMLYLVHPTNFIKLLWKLFRPVLSVKFGQKLMYLNHLEDLKRHLPFDQLSVPAPVLKFDAKKADKHSVPHPVQKTPREKSKKAQLFGLSLNDIKQKTGRVIPIPVEQTVEYLKASGGVEVEGLFRRCARVSTMKEVQEKYDNGEVVDFHDYSDPHLAAAILKNFLREIQEPVMTYDLFESITKLKFLEASERVVEVQKMLENQLPEDNYTLLKYIFEFLQQVAAKSDVNLMTAENIAIVFGPNIAWPKGQANLTTVEHSVKLALILVKNFNDVFLK